MPLEFSAGAGKTLTIKGFGLSPTSDVDLGNLGTEISRSYTATDGTGDGTLVITFTCAANATAMKSVSIGTGGVQATGPACPSGSVSVYHGALPSDISSLVAWYDANDVSTITTGSDDLVSQWSDKSGEDNHAYQGTENRKPKYFASGGGIGEAHIRWGIGGAYKRLQTTNTVNWLKLSDGGKVNASFFVVFHWPGAGGSGLGSNILRMGGGSGATNTLNVSIDTGGTMMWHGSSNQCTGGTDSTALPDKVLGGWFWTDSGFVTRINGSVDDTDNTDTGTTERTQVLRFGGLDSSRWTDLEISEFLAFNTELTGSDLTAVESYLNAKWSIY